MPAEKEAVFSIEYLRECFDVRDGVLYWRERPPHHFASPANHATFIKKSAGKVAGRAEPKGYRQVKMRRDGIAYVLTVHRVVWAMHYGKWPEHTIDHIDRDRANNRIENLRDIPMAENLRNTARATGLPPGVGWFRGRPRAQIHIGGASVHLGTFASVDEAAAAHRRVRDHLIETARSMSPSVPDGGQP